MSCEDERWVWGASASRGRELAEAALPPPTGDGKTMILVCGTDGFVETWGGPVGRAPRQPDGSKGAKIQGPLSGILADAGYDASVSFGSWTTSTTACHTGEGGSLHMYTALDFIKPSNQPAATQSKPWSSGSWAIIHSVQAF